MKKLIASVVISATLFTSVCLPASAETIKLAYSNGSLKLRSKPNTTSTVKAYLSDGAKVTVLSKGSIWSKIKLTNGKTGYVKNLYIKGNGSNYASGTTYYKDKYTATVKTKYASSAVNLRSGASTSTKSQGSVKNGAKVTVLGKNGSWYLVATKNGTQGYIKSSYISKSGASSSTTAKVTGSVVHMRKAKNSTSSVVTSLAKGTQVKVLSTANAKWWKVQYKNYTGYMYSKFLKK